MILNEKTRGRILDVIYLRNFDYPYCGHSRGEEHFYREMAENAINKPKIEKFRNLSPVLQKLTHMHLFAVPKTFQESRLIQRLNPLTRTRNKHWASESKLLILDLMGAEIEGASPEDLRKNVIGNVRGIEFSTWYESYFFQNIEKHSQSSDWQKRPEHGVLMPIHDAVEKWFKDPKNEYALKFLAGPPHFYTYVL